MTKKKLNGILAFILCGCIYTFILGESGFGTLSEVLALSSDISVNDTNDSNVYYVPLCDKNGNELCQLQMGGAFTRSYYADGITYQLTLNGITVEVSKDTNLVTKISISDGSYFQAVAFDETTDYVDILGDICGVPMYRIVDSLFANCSSITEVAIRYNVRYIGKRAFENCINMKAITMPNSITDIGGCAFIGCKSLESVKLPKNITSLPGDGNYGFFEECTSLSSVTIPDSVMEIGYAAFWHCHSLKEIVIPDNVNTIGAWSFSECNSLESVHLPEGLQTISVGLFKDSKQLKHVNIPSTVIEIEEQVFDGCDGIQSLNIPVGLTDFSFSNFVGCNGLKEIVIDENHPLYVCENNIVFNSDKTEIVFCPYALDIDEYTIPDGVAKVSGFQSKNVSKIVVPSSVTELGYSAFSGCVNLKEVVLPTNDDLTEINYYLFSGCTSLEKINIPENITKISGSAFQNCSSLKEISIPASIEEIGREAFLWCDSLSDIYYDGTFSDWRSLINKYNQYTGILDENTVWIHCSQTNIYKNTLYYEENEESIIITDHRKINSTVVIPEEIDGLPVTEIKSQAFNEYTAYGSYQYPIKNIVIPNTVTKIGNRAFLNCSSLKCVELPNSLTSIETSTFKDCTSLQYIQIPKGVKTIKSEAFYGCKSLTDVYFNGTEEEWNNIEINSGNIPLAIATIHFNYSDVQGDINIDGVLNVADVVLLQKWLLAIPDTNLPNWKAADLCADNRLDVFDLCLMKRQLIYG